LRERRDTLPSVSTIYRVSKRYHLNRRTPAMREEKRRIIKDNSVSWPHRSASIAARHVPRATLCTTYVVSLIDSCSRLAWAEVITSKKPCR